LHADRAKGHRGRPRFLTIYGPNGELLRKIEVSEPDQPPQDRTEEERELAKELEEIKRRAESDMDRP
jgi:hypothetical protein